MSKRKKYYNKSYDYNYRLGNLDLNQCPYMPMMQYDNFCNMFNMDFRKLATLMNLVSDGFDINNINFENSNYKNMNNSTYVNESVINFFIALKPILGIEIGNIIDKFIEFYMSEINDGENR